MVYIKQVIFNERNIAHIARHNGIPQEVEDVCFGTYLVDETYDNRLLVIGKTATGRLLSVVLSLQSETAYYVVTAHDASVRDRRWFTEEQKKGGETAA